MLRKALTAGLMTSALAASLALAAPAAAEGGPDAFHEAPAGPGRLHTGEAPAPRQARRPPPPGLARVQGSPVRPVSYGETDGAVYHAWLPRNPNLPIYNVPPPFFPEL